MSLEDFKKNLERIKEISSEYDNYMKDKKSIELDIRNLKAKFRENKIERDVFSEYNKRLEIAERELGKIRESVLKLCRKNSDIISDEMKNVL